MKPAKKTIIECYIWSECRDYIEKKYNINTRDYADKFAKNGRYYPDRPYQDFWHWICDRYCPNNDSIIIMWSNDKPSGWQGEVFQLFIDEFADEDGSITFWVEW